MIKPFVGPPYTPLGLHDHEPVYRKAILAHMNKVFGGAVHVRLPCTIEVVHPTECTADASVVESGTDLVES